MGDVLGVSFITSLGVLMWVLRQRRGERQLADWAARSGVNLTSHRWIVDWLNVGYRSAFRVVLIDRGGKPFEGRASWVPSQATSS